MKIKKKRSANRRRSASSWKRWTGLAGSLFLVLTLLTASCNRGDDSSGSSTTPETPDAGTGTVVLTGRIL